MKTLKVTMLVLCMGLAACTNPAPLASGQPEVRNPEAEKTEYAAYQESFGRLEKHDSWTLGVQSMYTFSFSDDTRSIYEMDATLSASGIKTDSVTAKLRQYINGNGMEVETSGVFDKSRFYGSYANVKYFEDMTFDQLKQTLLVPVDVIQIDSADVVSVRFRQDGTETVYSMDLNQEGAERLLLNRYDFYGLGQSGSFEVEKGVITQTMEESRLLGETADFRILLTVENQTVRVDYHSAIHYMNHDMTVVQTEDVNPADYIAYTEIDTDAISSADITDDQMEDTVTATFRKRLVNRLGYERLGNDRYRSSFNEGETYTIDFANRQFIYQNHTSTYTYNWKGDTGGFGSSCNYDYRTDTGSSECKESVLSTLKEIKMYFLMELYYCGLSLEDLQAES